MDSEENSSNSESKNSSEEEKEIQSKDEDNKQQRETKLLPLEKNMNNILHINKIKKNKFQVPINTYNNVFNYSKYSKRE